MRKQRKTKPLQKDFDAALLRAKSFIDEPQFIEADRNIGRCYIELVEICSKDKNP